MKFLFWNTNRRPAAKWVAAICGTRAVDFLILAESAETPVQIVEQINAGQVRVFHQPFGYSVDIRVFSKLPRDFVQPVRDDKGITILHISPPGALSFLLVAVNLPSKMHLQGNEQALLCGRAISSIQAAENHVGHSRTVVVGDFNMNPFEDGIAGSEGLHAVMSRAIASKRSRSVLGQDRDYFYNPMWNHFGDRGPGPQGTYFYQSGVVCFFWNMFDQVLLRPDLLGCFRDEDIEILTSAGTMSLVTTEGRPDKRISDHLPIYFDVDVESGGL